jgi:crotonobetainyl-CoA:carnitine CoA-transferase CaiB-like acyl-CoA transferase
LREARVGALDGIKVLDLTRALAGPFCTMILGDLGASVAKLEPLHDGDMSRSWGPFDDGESVYFLSTNRNKRSVAIDFRAPEGRELIRRLAREADVVVNNFKPGVMEDMELSSSALQSVNPKLVFVTITGFGADGPYGRRAGFDQIAQGMSGLMSVTGFDKGLGTRVGIPIGDLVCAMWAAIGTLAALQARQTTGTGAVVDTSLLRGLLAILGVQGQRYLSLGEVAECVGNSHPTLAPYGTFQCSDGALNLAPATQDMWEQLCHLLDLTDLLEDPSFRTNALRVANRPDLEARINRGLRSRRREHVMAIMEKAGIPAGPIYDIAQAFADDHVQAAGLIESVARMGKEATKVLPVGVKLSCSAGPHAAPPLLGEHTREVLLESGISAAEIQRLIDRCVLRQWTGNSSAA